LTASPNTLTTLVFGHALPSPIGADLAHYALPFITCVFMLAAVWTLVVGDQAVGEKSGDLADYGLATRALMEAVFGSGPMGDVSCNGCA
jgi:hypothetical protein